MAPLDFHTTATFSDFNRMGFRELLPVIPATAKSALPVALLGKAPGERDSAGVWWPMKGWRHVLADGAMLLKWTTWGANIGHRCGESIWAIDLDITDETVVNLIRHWIQTNHGTALERVGNAPKTALIFRCSEPVASSSILFKANGAVHRIDILGTGRQIVLGGIHPKTLQPYRRQWPGEQAVSALPSFTGLEAAELVTILTAFITTQGWELVTVSRPGRVAAGSPPNQAGLKAPIGWVRGVMRGLRNDVERFGSYERWLDVGYALKAATQDDPETGRDIWIDWCSKYEGDSNGEENLRTWDKIKGPFYLGAHALADFAGVSSASLDFAPIEDESDAPPPWATFFRLEGEESLEAPPPELKLVDGLIGERTLAMLWARSGSLKSFIAQSLSVAVATGTEWMGRTVTQGGALYFAGEGGAGLGVRIVAARQQAGLAKGSLTFWRRANMAPEIAKRPELRRAIIDACRALGDEWGVPIRLIVIDTLATSFTGDENSNSDMRDYWKAAAEIRDRTGATVIVVHHSGKDEERGARGAQAGRDFADTVIHVERPDPEQPRVVFTVEKQREGIDNVRIAMEAVKIVADLGPGGLHETLAVTGGGAVTPPSAEPVVTAEDKEDIRAAMGTDEWRRDRQSTAYAGALVGHALGLTLMTKQDRAKIESILCHMIESGDLVEYEKFDHKRRPRKYIRVKDLDPFN